MKHYSKIDRGSHNEINTMDTMGIKSVSIRINVLLVDAQKKLISRLKVYTERAQGDSILSLLPF